MEAPFRLVIFAIDVALNPCKFRIFIFYFFESSISSSIWVEIYGDTCISIWVLTKTTLTTGVEFIYYDTLSWSYGRIYLRVTGNIGVVVKIASVSPLHNNHRRLQYKFVKSIRNRTPPSKVDINVTSNLFRSFMWFTVIRMTLSNDIIVVESSCFATFLNPAYSAVYILHSVNILNRAQVCST